MRTSKRINTMVVATMIIHAVVDTVVETLGVEEEQVAEEKEKEEEVVEAEEATVATKIWVVIMTEVTEAAKQCVFRIMSQLKTDSSA